MHNITKKSVKRKIENNQKKMKKMMKCSKTSPFPHPTQTLLMKTSAQTGLRHLAQLCDTKNRF